MSHYKSKYVKGKEPIRKWTEHLHSFQKRSSDGQEYIWQSHNFTHNQGKEKFKQES